MKRLVFESKYWTAFVEGTTLRTQFGKLGSPGQTRLAELGSASGAKSDAEKRAMQKRKAGYKNVPRK